MGLDVQIIETKSIGFLSYSTAGFKIRRQHNRGQRDEIEEIIEGMRSKLL